MLNYDLNMRLSLVVNEVWVDEDTPSTHEKSMKNQSVH